MIGLPNPRGVRFDRQSGRVRRMAARRETCHNCLRLLEGRLSTVDAAIEMRGVSKTFGHFKAVDDFDLVVPTGSICGFLGPNGAGKTTTIRMIMSIIFPDYGGEISVLGQPTAVESKDRIGYLPEERGVYRKMRTGEFLIYIARLKGVDGTTARRRAKEWLDRVELRDIFKKKLEELSKGMQQKVQLAAALIHEPELIILDEPFTGLDPVNARLMRDLIMQLNREQRRTFIFSTHVLHQAEMMCDRIIMINLGRKVLDASLEEVRERFAPRTLLVRTGQEGFDPTSIKGVTGVNQLNGELEIHVDKQADPLQVMRALLNAGDLSKVELRQPTLDDVFISLVQDARMNEFGELEVPVDD